MEEIQEKPKDVKDAGLIIMLLLVVAGTLFMAWVADNSTEAARPAAITESAGEALTVR